MKHAHPLLLVLLVAALAAGCASSGRYDVAPPAPHEPAWLAGDPERMWDGQPDQGFAAVGSAEGTRDVRELQSQAVLDARSRLKLDLEPGLKLALRDHVRSKSGRKEYGAEPNQQYVEADLGRLVDAIASSGRVMDYWITPELVLYVLVAVTEEDYHAGVQKAPRISAELQQRVHEGGEKIFSRIHEHGLRVYLEGVRDQAVKAAR